MVEVSDSRLAFDRHRKAAIYARAGVQDYWIVNLIDSVVEVRRDPGPLAPPERGHGYRAIETLRAPSMLSPLAAPAARISVADFPP